MEIALYQPDQPQNTGTLLRLGACLDVPVHIIDPCGFPFSLKAFRRAAMDYADHVTVIRHVNFDAFLNHVKQEQKRLVLLTTKAANHFTDASYQKDDILMLGQESAGVPDHVHEIADERVVIPMANNMRSLNIAIAASMVLSEALRQTQSFPE